MALHTTFKISINKSFKIIYNSFGFAYNESIKVHIIL
jgi:hypothetical protein